MPPIKWDEKSIRDFLLQQRFSRVVDWKKSAPSCYAAALRKCPYVIEQFFPHRKLIKKYWTKDALQKLLQSKTWRSYTYFRNNHRGADKAIRKHYPFLIDKYFPYRSQKKYKWNKSNLIEFLQTENFISISVLQKEHSGVYRALYQRFPDLITRFFPNRRNRQKRTFAEILNEARKFNGRGDFQMKSSGAYSYARNKGWLEKVCAHMKPKTNNSRKRLVYAIEFRDCSAYIGLTYDLKERLVGHSRRGAVFNHSKACPHYHVRILEENLKSNDAGLRESYWISRYRREKWKIINQAKPGGLGSTMPSAYTIKKLTQIAKKFKLRCDFKKYRPNEYAACHRRGILSSVCKHMKHVKTKWTDEALLKAASKYTTRKRFATGSPNAYRAACTRGIENFCKHMQPSKTKQRKIIRLHDGKVFHSIGEASRVLGISRTSILNSCCYKTEASYGMKFRFTSEDKG
jgi:predicted GIY-YIG superfamily endonuclease